MSTIFFPWKSQNKCGAQPWECVEDWWVFSELLREGNRLYSYHLSRLQSHPPNYTTYYLTLTEPKSKMPHVHIRFGSMKPLWPANNACHSVLCWLLQAYVLIGQHDCPSGDDSLRVADSAVSLGKTVDCIVISKRGYTTPQLFNLLPQPQGQHPRCFNIKDPQR